MIITVALLVAWLVVPGNAEAQGNLLTNGGFDQPHGDGSTLTAPPGWQVTSNVSSGLVGRYLAAGQEVVSSAGIYQGSGSFDAYKGWAAYSISLYQTVSGIQPGSTLRLAAFGRMWSCDSDPELSSDACITGDGGVVSQTFTGASFRVGIDPTGSNDPNSGSIVWSGSTAPYEGFQQMLVDAAATADRVTVVLNASMQQPARHQHVFWDAASLTVTDGSTTTSSSTSGQPVVSGVAAEVVPQGTREDGSIIHTVRSGDTVAAIAVAYNVTIPELLELNGMTTEDARMIYPGQELIVVAGTGSAAEPSAASDSDSEAGQAGQEEGSAGEELAPLQPGDRKPIEEYEDAPVASGALPVLVMADAAVAGRVCTLLFDDMVTANGLQESGEPLLAGGQINLTMAEGTSQSYTTDGMAEPYCFEDLAPGQYLVVVSAPSGYGVTTASMYNVRVDAGQTVDAVFGAAAGFVPPQPAPAQGGVLFSDEQGNETDTVTDPVEMILQNSGLIVLGFAGLVLLGGIGLVALLRR